MKFVVGLGNPGRRYAGTRHNLGYAVVDALGRCHGIDLSRHVPRFEAFVGEGMIAGQRVVLLKPTGYMNRSGESVAAVIRFYKRPLDELLLVCDDVDLAVGQLRLRAGGSSGGHRGLEDIFRHLGSNGIARLRLGIGRPPRGRGAEYVLSRFAPHEQTWIEEVIARGVAAVCCWIERGIGAAMNQYNRRADEDTPGGQSSLDAPEEGDGS